MRRSISNGGQLLLLLILLVAGLCPHLSAQNSNNSGALFLVLPIGARAVGMGQTAVTLEGHGEAAFWNPAGLGTMSENEFALQNATLSAGTIHALTAYFRPGR